MPAFLNWLLRLLPTNPICMRLVYGGSRRLRHLYLRAGYLGIMIIVLLFVLISAVQGTLSMRELAGAGATVFRNVSYLQVGLICLLTPIFMAGAIAQEANPKTWDILLTTPLNNIQIVFGNLFGRLFFVIALLFSSLPLFVMTQYFGGVPGESIFASYAIAGASALLVAAIAVTLSVTRTAGRRAVFIFYVSVVMYLFITYSADLLLRSGAISPTTVMTPLNPFLALKVLLDSNNYYAHDFTGESVVWIKRLWFGQPIATFCWLCMILSLDLTLFSTIRVRTIGTRVGAIPWYRRMLKLGARGATERPARSVARNPIAWRESVARGKTLTAILGRWGFLAAGLLVAIVMLTLYHVGQLNNAQFRLAVGAVVTAEVVIIALAALNMSATAVSREREDGTLDLILTTPIQPGPYLKGKHRGLFQFLIPMMLVPTLTMWIIAIYIFFDGFGRAVGEGGARETIMVVDPNPLGAGNLPAVPVVLPEAAIVVPLVLGAFIAFCVMVGLHWSIRSRGTIGSVIVAVVLVIAVAGIAGLCGVPAGKSLSHLGAGVNAFSPINAIFALVMPAMMIEHSMSQNVESARWALVIGSLFAAAFYILIAYLMHTNMTRTFMFTVRRLAGAH